MQFYNHPKFNVMSQKTSSVLIFHEATKQTMKVSQVMMKLQVLVTSVLDFFLLLRTKLKVSQMMILKVLVTYIRTGRPKDETQSPGRIGLKT